MAPRRGDDFGEGDRATKALLAVFGGALGCFVAVFLLALIGIGVVVVRFVLPAVERAQEAAERFEEQRRAAREASSSQGRGASAARSYREGDVGVEVVSLEIPSAQGERFLLLRIKITNHSRTRKLDCVSWHGKPSDVRLTDERGNPYGGVPMYGKDLPGMRGEKFSVPPGGSAEDLLVFEAPSDQARTLLLELPGGHVGITGPVRIDLPTTPFP